MGVIRLMGQFDTGMKPPPVSLVLFIRTGTGNFKTEEIIPHAHVLETIGTYWEEPGTFETQIAQFNHVL